MCIPCTTPAVKKVRVGISFDSDVVEAVDVQVAASPNLSADRSEIVNALTKFFFDIVDGDHDINLRTRGLLIRERRRKGGRAGSGNHTR
jgi:hypothetical protein